MMIRVRPTMRWDANDQVLEVHTPNDDRMISVRHLVEIENRGSDVGCVVTVNRGGTAICYQLDQTFEEFVLKNAVALNGD